MEKKYKKKIPIQHREENKNIKFRDQLLVKSPFLRDRAQAAHLSFQDFHYTRTETLEGDCYLEGARNNKADERHAMLEIRHLAHIYHFICK